MKTQEEIIEMIPDAIYMLQWYIASGDGYAQSEEMGKIYLLEKIFNIKTDNIIKKFPTSFERYFGHKVRDEEVSEEDLLDFYRKEIIPLIKQQF